MEHSLGLVLTVQELNAKPPTSLWLHAAFVPQVCSHWKQQPRMRLTLCLPVPSGCQKPRGLIYELAHRLPCHVKLACCAYTLFIATQGKGPKPAIKACRRETLWEGATSDECSRELRFCWCSTNIPPKKVIYFKDFTATCQWRFSFMVTSWIWVIATGCKIFFLETFCRSRLKFKTSPWILLQTSFLLVYLLFTIIFIILFTVKFHKCIDS